MNLVKLFSQWEDAIKSAGSGLHLKIDTAHAEHVRPAPHLLGKHNQMGSFQTKELQLLGSQPSAWLT